MMKNTLTSAVLTVALCSNAFAVSGGSGLPTVTGVFDIDQVAFSVTGYIPPGYESLYYDDFSSYLPGTSQFSGGCLSNPLVQICGDNPAFDDSSGSNIITSMSPIYDIVLAANNVATFIGIEFDYVSFGTEGVIDDIYVEALDINGTQLFSGEVSSAGGFVGIAVDNGEYFGGIFIAPLIGDDGDLSGDLSIKSVTLAKIPNPNTALSMILGIGILGICMRRRQSGLIIR